MSEYIQAMAMIDITIRRNIRFVDQKQSLTIEMINHIAYYGTIQRCFFFILINNKLVKYGTILGSNRLTDISFTTLRQNKHLYHVAVEFLRPSDVIIAIKM